MRKKLVASGIILFILGFLVAFVPEQSAVQIDVSLYPTTGIMVAIVGIVLVVIGLCTMLAERL